MSKKRDEIVGQNSAEQTADTGGMKYNMIVSSKDGGRSIYGTQSNSYGYVSPPKTEDYHFPINVPGTQIQTADNTPQFVAYNIPSKASGEQAQAVKNQPKPDKRQADRPTAADKQAKQPVPPKKRGEKKGSGNIKTVFWFVVILFLLAIVGAAYNRYFVVPEAITYTVAFDSNGGTDIASVTVKADDNVVAKPTDPTKDNYNFDGWFDNAGLSGTAVDFPYKANGDITLYAAWKVVEYSIFYILDGGINHSDNPLTYTYYDSDIEIKKPSKSGYTFLGWTGDGISLTLPYVITSGSKGILTLTANWAEHFTITASVNGTGGTIFPDGNVSAIIGDDRTFDIAPNVGHYIADVFVDGVSVGAVSSYTFYNVTSNHTITADFDINLFNIYAYAGQGGTISPNGTVIVPYDGSQAFTAEPITDYKFSYFLIDESIIYTSDNIYTFANATANHMIVAYFELIPAADYTITASATSIIDVGSTISPVGNVSVLYGADRIFTFSLNGDEVLSIIVDGNALSDIEIAYAVSNGYTFYNVAANHTIRVSFIPAGATTFAVTATSGANGSITPNGVVSILAGQEQLYNFTPNGGYKVLNVFVDGIALDGAALTNAINNGYLMDNIITDRTIDVTFAPIWAAIYQIEATPTYPIIGVPPTGNRIIPSGIINVASGGSFTFEIAVNSGYHAVSIIIDGVPLTGAELSDAVIYGYTFANVTENHSIEITFAHD
ncbi:MAG: InlB B-repeat-containing protein [Clostridiales bacterium]|nr:InlB B-repeat-containing protein [Clostridiales bacterium]